MGRRLLVPDEVLVFENGLEILRVNLFLTRDQVLESDDRHRLLYGVLEFGICLSREDESLDLRKSWRNEARQETMTANKRDD